MKVTGFSRVSKELIIKEVETQIKKGEGFIITNYDKVPATNLDKLRAKLRATKSRFFVVKNTLGQKAFERANMKDMAQHVQGACGIAFTGGDPVAPSKVLMEFAKENEGFKVRVGQIQGKLVSVDQIKVLASLPPREVLLARVVGQMQAPISGFVNVLAGTLRKFVNVVDAIHKKKSQG